MIGLYSLAESIISRRLYLELIIESLPWLLLGINTSFANVADGPRKWSHRSKGFGSY
jgi:hypothetical protein